MRQPYTSTSDYLHDYFSLLALRLHRQVALTRLLRSEGQNDAFLGLFLSEEEISAILNELHGIQVKGGEEVVNLETSEAALCAQIEARLAATQLPLRPFQLATLFALSPLALEVLLLLLALETDNRFARVYAYLQDDVARRWLSPGLAIRLLPNRAASDPNLRSLFTADSSLVRERLIHVGGGEHAQTPLLDRPIKLDDRIAEYLLEHDPLDPLLVGLVTTDVGEEINEERALETSLCAQLEHVLALWQDFKWQDGKWQDVKRHDAGAPALFVWGRAGSGKTKGAAWLAQRLNRPLLQLDCTLLATYPVDRVDEIIRVAIRERRLRRAILLVRQVDLLDSERMAVVLRYLQSGMILSARRHLHFHEHPQPPLSIHFMVPEHATRLRLWQRSLNGHFQGQASTRTETLADELAGRFQLTAGQIQRATLLAHHYAWLRAGLQATPERADLFEGCRQQSNPNLARLAAKVVTPYTWADLILPETQFTLLRAIEAQMRHSQRVYREWGFEHKLALGKGLNVLFSGQPGTGKTMAAGILAQSLGLEIYKIDLSGVVSKYIGETEKNLSQIFEEASTANVVLFFDEADALFGKRSEVKDAHDRYANIEISYLLQKMEEYEGVTILATNLSQNIDEAFSRRMHFWIDFPFPSASDRERIWRSIFPAQAPRTEDIDYAFLAGQFELAGGNIKNCVLAAAFMAAEDELPISMAHLLQAVVRELNKLGRPITRANFADYYSLIRRSRV